MYKIKNITRGKLLLSDLGIKLNSGDTIDLDTSHSRAQIELSVNLRVAEENELIAILHKDIIPQQSPTLDPNILLDMERRIREQIVQQTQAAEVPQSTNTDVADLTAKVSELISKINTQPQLASSVTDSSIEITTDESKLLEIHGKTIKRLTRNSSGHVEIQETTGNSEANDRASELEDFLK